MRELIYQVHGISITKLLIRADVFYLNRVGPKALWKMNEAEVRGGQSLHIIINSLGLLKSNAGLFMGRVLALPEMETVNDKQKRGPVPRAQGCDWETSVQGRSCE